MQEVSRVSPRTQALLTKTEFQSILHVNPSSPALQFLAFLKKMAKTEVEEATSAGKEDLLKASVYQYEAMDF